MAQYHESRFDQFGSDNRAMEIMERSLNEFFEREVQKAITDIVSNKMNDLIRDAAKSAVEAWSVQMSAEKKPDFFMDTNIVVRFVENIIRTEVQHEPKITIEDMNEMMKPRGASNGF